MRYTKRMAGARYRTPSSYGTAKGVANIVNFTPVRTKALKLEIVQPEKHSCGVFEWSVK